MKWRTLNVLTALVALLLLGGAALAQQPQPSTEAEPAAVEAVSPGDVAAVSPAAATALCQPGADYNPACDVNGDGVINLSDVQQTASRWGQRGTYVSSGTTALDRSAPQANVLTTLDATGDVGEHTSITIGADSVPVVAYYDVTNTALKVLHCDSPRCTSGKLTTVDNAADVGQYTSIAIGTDGLPIISYYDATNSALKVVHCGNVTCDSGNYIKSLESDGSSGMYSSIVIGADGYAIIGYEKDADLKIYHCTNVTCSSGANRALDVGAVSGLYTSIAVGADGLPIISYNLDGVLKVCHCGNADCSAGNNLAAIDYPTAPGTIAGQYTSIAIGVDGLAVVGYYDVSLQSLKVLHCDSAVCDSQTFGEVLNPVTINYYTSISVGVDGLPRIAFYDAGAQALKVLHCYGVTCDTGTPAVTAVDSGSSVGQYPSITFGTDGLAVISYHHGGSGDLKVAYCANALCSPYFRRR